MKSSFIRFLLPMAVAFSATTPSAIAYEVPPGPATESEAQGPADVLLADDDAAQVRDVIVAQIQAMAENDAERMFETTTPEVREAIGSSGRFLAMMHGAYPMVYQPSSVSFHRPHKKSDGAFQLVEIKDREDESWLAVFILEQQPDRSWRISGCAVTENPWLPA